jgi:hypothetical protein
VDIAKDGDTSCPAGNGRIAFYSKNGGRLSAPLPVGWNVEALAALALYPDRAKEVPVIKTGGK